MRWGSRVMEEDCGDAVEDLLGVRALLLDMSILRIVGETFIKKHRPTAVSSHPPYRRRIDSYNASLAGFQKETEATLRSIGWRKRAHISHPGRQQLARRAFSRAVVLGSTSRPRRPKVPKPVIRSLCY